MTAFERVPTLAERAAEVAAWKRYAEALAAMNRAMERYADLEEARVPAPALGALRNGLSFALEAVAAGMALGEDVEAARNMVGSVAIISALLRDRGRPGAAALHREAVAALGRCRPPEGEQ